jgi:hypothetical protein
MLFVGRMGEIHRRWPHLLLDATAGNVPNTWERAGRRKGAGSTPVSVPMAPKNCPLKYRMNRAAGLTGQAGRIAT